MRVLSVLVLAACALDAHADEEPAVKWHWQVTPQTAKAGDEVELHVVADIPAGWILYSSDFKAEMGPRPAKFVFAANDSVELLGPVQAVKSQRLKDKTFGTEYAYFAKQGEFLQKARLLKDSGTIAGQINGQTCQEKDGLCSLFKQPFSVSLQ